MTRYEYDEEASTAWHMDVVHESARSPASSWNFHRDCGSGTGVCDSLYDDPDPMDRNSSWGCETTQVIADHLSVEYPRVA